MYLNDLIEFKNVYLGLAKITVVDDKLHLIVCLNTFGKFHLIAWEKIDSLIPPWNNYVGSLSLFEPKYDICINYIKALPIFLKSYDSLQLFEWENSL